MTIVIIFLAIGLFSMDLFLILRYGSDYPLWLYFIIVAIVVGVLFLDKSDFFMYDGLLMFFAVISSHFTGYAILRKRAGKRVLTYKRSTASMVSRLIYTAVAFYLVFLIVSPYKYSYSRTELPIGIIMAFLGLSSLFTALRRGECFENGIADQDFRFYPWSGYKAYEWKGYFKRNEKRFLLFLEGAQNVSHTIDDLSEYDKNILDELLSSKLEKITMSKN